MIINKKEIKLMADSIRMLSMVSVLKAKGGHIGTPMGAADIMAVLMADQLNICAEHPQWSNRDRFVLSNGHACIMLYSALHLLGYKKFGIEDLKNLRQLGSITAGHPEINHAAGIEVTTGPLGQGVSMAVGLAIQGRLASNNIQPCDHLVYTMVGDGCLMEGVCYEALSLAGRLALNNLVVIYDRNNITIDGELSISSNEDIIQRMKATQFNVIEVNGHDYDELRQGFAQAKDYTKNSNKPTFIICNTVIGYGIPGQENEAKVHGFSISSSDVEPTKKKLNWQSEDFTIPESAKDVWKKVQKRQKAQYEKWFALHKNIKDTSIKHKRVDLEQALKGLAEKSIEEKAAMPTREASKIVLGILQSFHNLIGGSADLTGSNCTQNDNSTAITEGGNYISYGVREHGMGAIMNGIAAYIEHEEVDSEYLGQKSIPYGGTYLAFSDFLRPAIRLSAIMKRQVIYIFSHDSLTVGGDGQTHQPIEHVDALRLIPNTEVLRPADIIEMIEAYQIALSNHDKPTLMVLGKLAVPHLRGSFDINSNQVAQGGYILVDCEQGDQRINLISSGSDLHIVKDVKEVLDSQGIHCHVISMPSIDRFSKLSSDKQREVLGDNPINIFIEMKGVSNYAKIFTNRTYYYDLTSFGIAGDSDDVVDYFGFSVAKIAKFVSNIVEQS